MSEEELMKNIPIKKDNEGNLYFRAKEVENIINEQEQEIERLHSIIKEAREYVDEHIKYECDNAFNSMQFYSYHLYDFNKNKLLEILDKVGEADD